MQRKTIALYNHTVVNQQRTVKADERLARGTASPYKEKRWLLVALVVRS